MLSNYICCIACFLQIYCTYSSDHHQLTVHSEMQISYEYGYSTSDVTKLVKIRIC